MNCPLNIKVKRNCLECNFYVQQDEMDFYGCVFWVLAKEQCSGNNSAIRQLTRIADALERITSAEKE